MLKRIDNSVSIKADEIAADIGVGHQVIVQYSKPLYTPSLLQQLNDLCDRFGPEFEIRFYGHYGGVFNAAVLRQLPNVKSLLIDCLQDVENPQAIYELRNLRHFAFGVYRWSDPQFLHSMNLAGIEKLVIGATAKPSIDLTALSGCQKLSDVTVEGHTKGIEVFTRLSALRSVSLRSIPKTCAVGFVSDIPSLMRLSIILGGRANIADISHPHLEELEIIRVRGFERLHNLSAFPALRQLSIEDQIRLSELDLSPANQDLETLRIFNCKTLRNLTGLKYATHLRHLRIGTTMLDLESLIAQPLSRSLKIFAFYTGKTRENAKIRARLDELGYAEFDPPKHA